MAVLQMAAAGRAGGKAAGHRLGGRGPGSGDEGEAAPGEADLVDLDLDLGVGGGRSTPSRGSRHSRPSTTRSSGAAAEAEPQLLQRRCA